MYSQTFSQQTHGQSHAVRAADVVQMLMRFDLSRDLVFGADFHRFKTIFDFCLVIMNPPSTEMHMDNRADIGAVKARDHGIDD